MFARLLNLDAKELGIQARPSASLKYFARTSDNKQPVNYAAARRLSPQPSRRARCQKGRPGAAGVAHLAALVLLLLGARHLT
jgi:hypothetical protein